MHRHAWGLPAIPFLLMGCGAAPPGPAGAPPGGGARAETSARAPDPGLAALAAEYWEKRLLRNPVEATLLGDRRHDDRLPEITPDARRREEEELRNLLARVAARDAGTLGEGDQVTHGALVEAIERDLAVLECRLRDWTVDPLRGPQVWLQNLGTLQTVATKEHARAMVARWRRMGPYLDDHAANLRAAREEGRVATRANLERVIAQLDALLAAPLEGWALLAPLRRLPPSLTPEDQETFRAGLTEAVERGVAPALRRYRELLRTEILPRARDERRPGLQHVPGGDACYAKLIRVHTSLALSAEEVHKVGLEEIARIREEMRRLGARLLGTDDLAEIQRRLRGDPAMFFSTRLEVEAKATEKVALATAIAPRWFGRLPRVPCVVKPVEPYEEKDSTIAYYRPPAIDGSRPGTYHVNTSQPHTRPRYEAEVLAIHEAVPGHHTQIALAQELAGLPEFRKHASVTAFVEGWALYTERLADEMGLYSADLDRMGMLSFDAWRASRLVVDSGLHALGWTRGRAVEFMLENTVLAPGNIENEVDRYITWPGQALAYKLGQREILRLRAEAERKLGPRFDIRAFHDAVLENGAISPALLRGRVERFIERASRPGR